MVADIIGGMTSAADAIAARQKPAPGTLALDHISHFLPDLDAAAAWLERLGFAVTPLSVQQTQDGPAGSSNRCVMLEEGYLEFLTPTLDTPVARQMRLYMARHIGTHLACFGTPEAAFEHQRLAAHGFAPLPLVHLARQVADGRTVRFNVVRVPPEKMPEGRIQFVEHLAPECIWVDESLRHDNGVLALDAVFVVAEDPVATAARWAEFAGLLPRREGERIRIETDRGDIVVATRAVLAAALGVAPEAPALAGYGLRCRDARAFADRCRQAGLAVQPTDGGYAVRLPPALGGTWRIR